MEWRDAFIMSKSDGNKVSWDTVEAVQKMQDYIKVNAFSETFSVADVYSHVGYSRRHCERIFKELVNRSINEYVKLIRLTESATELRDDTKQSVLEVALHAKYNSHEGYLRAFHQEFGVCPNEYRKKPVPIPLFVQYPVRSYYSYLYHKENMEMKKEALLCMISVVSRPKRKLLLLRSTKGHDYWSYCEEMGCEWEGLFNSIPEKFDTAAILELPENLCKKGFTKVAAGVEVPDSYDGPIPTNCELIDLEACDMMYFQTEPFEKEEEFGAAIDSVFRAIDKYPVRDYGFEYDFLAAPKFNFGASTQMGAKQALPVKKY